MNGMTLGFAGGSPGTKKMGIPVSLTTVIIVLAVGGLIAMQYRYNKSIVFKDIAIVSAQHRGPDGEVRPPRYSDDVLEGIANVLQENVLAAYTEAVPPVKKGLFGGVKQEWILGSSLQELFDGTLLVEVKAFSFEGEELAKEWSREMADIDAFDAGITELASAITKDLAALSRATPPIE